MKTRQGFVSNSSSCSFVLAVDKSQKDEDIKVEISIEGCINYRITTEKELKNYFVDYYGWKEMTFEQLIEEEEEWIQERFNKMLEKIKAGKVLVAGQASNDDYEYASSAIYNGALHHLDQEGVEVIDPGEC
jgi:hypothetical protein